MTKPLVVFVTIADWANTTYEAMRAVNHVGEIEARHITFWKHPWDYPADILVDIIPKPGETILFHEHPKATEVIDLFMRADLVHLWNCEYQELRNFPQAIPMPRDKIKSSTFAGSAFRNDNVAIRNRLRKDDIACIVEDPTFHWDDKVLETTFIPHAIDTDNLTPLEYNERNAGSIGIYNPGRPYYDRDIAALQKVIDEHANGCYLAMNRLPIPWNMHLAELRRCWWFYQNMDTVLGTFGRSALEACAMGIPVFSYVSDKAKEHQVVGGFHDETCGIIDITPETLSKQLHAAVNGDLGTYEKLSTNARSWVTRHYGYNTVGRMYTDMFKELIHG